MLNRTRTGRGVSNTSQRSTKPAPQSKSAEHVSTLSYKELGGQDLILRDWLAIDRTALANERTLLAYARTGLALAIVGGSLIKFFDTFAADAAGCLLLIASPLTIAAGLGRFLSVRRRLDGIGNRGTSAPESHPEAAPSVRDGLSFQAAGAPPGRSEALS